MGLNIPMRKPSIEIDWSVLAKAPETLAQGGVVCGDVRIDVMHNHKRLLRFWFHTAFIDNGQKQSELMLPKQEIDGPHKDRKCKAYDPEFHVNLYFERCEPKEPREERATVLERPSR